MGKIDDLDGNSAALRAYERRQDQLEREYDPEEAALELQRSLSWSDLMEAMEQVSHGDGARIIESLRLGNNRELSDVGYMIAGVVEDWARAKANGGIER